MSYQEDTFYLFYDRCFFTNTGRARLIRSFFEIFATFLLFHV